MGLEVNYHPDLDEAEALDSRDEEYKLRLMQDTLRIANVEPREEEQEEEDETDSLKASLRTFLRAAKSTAYDVLFPCSAKEKHCTDAIEVRRATRGAGGALTREDEEALQQLLNKQ